MENKPDTSVPWLVILVGIGIGYALLQALIIMGTALNQHMN